MNVLVPPHGDTDVPTPNIQESIPMLQTIETGLMKTLNNSVLQLAFNSNNKLFFSVHSQKYQSLLSDLEFRISRRRISSNRAFLIYGGTSFSLTGCFTLSVGVSLES